MAREPKFAGNCDGLSGFIYDFSDGKHYARFNIVTKEIAEYVGREYRFGGDIRWTIQNLSLYKEEESKECADATSAVKKRMWERRVDEFIKREDKLDENCQSAYLLAIGQCTEYMIAKLAAKTGYQDMETKSDLVELIKTIKGLSFQFEGQQSKTRGRLLAHRRFHQLVQYRDMTNARFLEKFLTSVSVLEQDGGTLGRDEGGIEDEITEAGYTLPTSDKETKTASDTATDKFLGMPFMISVDRYRYGTLLEELKNDTNKGTDNYPVTVTKAYTLMVNHKSQQRGVTHCLMIRKPSHLPTSTGKRSRRTSTQ
jgi:hypothetical protein